MHWSRPWKVTESEPVGDNTVVDSMAAVTFCIGAMQRGQDTGYNVSFPWFHIAAKHSATTKSMYYEKTRRIRSLDMPLWWWAFYHQLHRHSRKTCLGNCGNGKFTTHVRSEQDSGDALKAASIRITASIDSSVRDFPVSTFSAGTKFYVASSKHPSKITCGLKYSRWSNKAKLSRRNLTQK